MCSSFCELWISSLFLLFWCNVQSVRCLDNRKDIPTFFFWINFPLLLYSGHQGTLTGVGILPESGHLLLLTISRGPLSLLDLSPHISSSKFWEWFFLCFFKYWIQNEHIKLETHDHMLIGDLTIGIWMKFYIFRGKTMRCCQLTSYHCFPSYCGWGWEHPGSAMVPGGHSVCVCVLVWVTSEFLKAGVLEPIALICDP